MIILNRKFGFLLPQMVEICLYNNKIAVVSSNIYLLLHRQDALLCFQNNTRFFKNIGLQYL